MTPSRTDSRRRIAELSSALDAAMALQTASDRQLSALLLKIREAGPTDSLEQAASVMARNVFTATIQIEALRLRMRFALATATDPETLALRRLAEDNNNFQLGD